MKALSISAYVSSPSIMASRRNSAGSRRLTETFDRLDPALFRREAMIDGELTFAEIDSAFIGAHELLQPFGAGNLQPLFLSRNVAVVDRRGFGEDCCELTLQDATGRATAVRWPSAKDLDAIVSAGHSDILFQLEPDAYAQSGARLTLIDARNTPSEA